MAACLGFAGALDAQAPSRPALSAGQAISLAASGLVYLAPAVLDINAGPPPCAPCDAAAVPSFDRWIIRPELPGASAASTVLVVGLGAATLWDQARGSDGLRRAAVTLEATAWAAALTAVAKAAIDRNRPVLYTSAAPAAADDLDSQRSLPSGHTAIAFALATSYWLNHRQPGTGPRLVAFAAAAGVGTLRVVAARHFPSDVLAGAALGVGTAVVVQEIRF